MSVIEGHPFDLGPVWRAALAGHPLDASVLEGFVAAVDWPASMFWDEIAEMNRDAIVLLSRRSTADVWWESFEATILPYARMSRSPGWCEGRDLVALLERFAGSREWDDRAVLTDAYERHLATVRVACEPSRLVEWEPGEGWGPICRALGLPMPANPFPWANRREQWSSDSG